MDVAARRIVEAFQLPRGAIDGFDHMMRMFSSIDRNSDGKLSTAELHRGLAKRRSQKLLRDIDVDMNGEISAGEFMKKLFFKDISWYWGKIFREIDVDRSGVLEKEELDAFLTSINIIGEDAENFMAEYDKNKNGQFELSEFKKYLSKKLEAIVDKELDSFYSSSSDIKIKYKGIVDRYRADTARKLKKYDALRDLDLIVFDNSLRESTVGALRGHTIENKWQIYDEVKKIGFDYMIVASFGQMTRVDDLFCQQLKEKNEDFSKFFSFSEITFKTTNKVPDTETVPIGLSKLKKFGLYNVIFEVDLGDFIYDFEKFPMSEMCKLIKKWIVWAHENLNKDAKVCVSFRDLPDVLDDTAERAFALIDFLAQLPEDIRPFGLCYEEPTGDRVPEECLLWSKYIRQMMNEHNWNAHLLVHIHQKYGLQDATNLKALAGGCDGMWAGICEEGAYVGAASSCVAITNLIRLGNKKVLKKFNCKMLRDAAINVTKITTGVPPLGRQVVYGSRAIEFVVNLNDEEFDMAGFYGEKRVVRMSTLATAEMVQLHLKELFGNKPEFTLDIATKMKEVMYDDLHKNRKEEYGTPAGTAILFDRAGGKLDEGMRDIVNKQKLIAPHAEALIAEVKQRWDTWDLKDGNLDNMLEFDAFYNGFMAPYFGCYRCADTKRALAALDMDSDGSVDWSEFKVYLIWTIRQYPTIIDADELVDVAFRKAIIPAMQDEMRQKRDSKK